MTGAYTERRSKISAYVAALRPHHWMKNVLLFVPLLTSHRASETDKIIDVTIGIVAFSICASCIYILNDISDIAADRVHPRKKFRPFASGQIPVIHGLAAIPLLLALGLGAALILSTQFLAVLLLYLVITVAYSLWFKNYVLVDVIVLASLFTIRVVAGGVAIDIFPSFWLLAFCVFLFLSLALIKRCAELMVVEKNGLSGTYGRDYQVKDLIPLTAMGISSGYLSVMVIALYINSEAVTDLYSHPMVLWFLCPPFLYWISRLWLKTIRGEMHDDPLIFAFRDRGTHFVVFACVVVLLISI